MKTQRIGKSLVRDADIGKLLELLFVMSLVTILVIRVILAATHYPKIATGDLHIAHLLWGGFLMLIALLIVFCYWNPSIRKLAAFLGGIGFGLFIDELGKFITQDNDYFFRPTFSIIYIIFVAMFLIFRWFLRRFPLSSRELAVNDALRRDIGDTFKPFRWYGILRKKVLGALQKCLAIPWVIPVVMILFAAARLLQLAVIFGVVSPPWSSFAQVLGPAKIGVLISILFVLIGLVRLGHSTVEAARWFRRSILVGIFLTQVYLFYESQLAALWAVAVNLVVYFSVDAFIREHEQKNESRASDRV
jgi:hypothetical protein